jgi:hypothetical protein
MNTHSSKVASFVENVTHMISNAQEHITRDSDWHEHRQMAQDNTLLVLQLCSTAQTERAAILTFLSTDRNAYIQYSAMPVQF